MIELQDDYSADKLLALPDDIKQKIKVRNINKSEATSREKDLLESKKIQAETVRARRSEKRGPVDVSVIEENAGTAETEHDKTWKTKGDREETGLVKRMLTTTYWNSVNATVFKADVFRVIPSFESDEAWHVSKTTIMKKTGKKYDLGKHMDLIKEESVNEFDDDSDA